MARVNNLLLQGTSGSIGKALVVKTTKTGTFSAKHPDMSAVIPSKNQTKGRQRFAEAVKFAKSVMNDPEKKAKYNVKRGSTLYHTVIKEYLSRFNPDKAVRLSLPEPVITSLQALSLTESQLRAVVYINEYKKLTNSDYRKMNDVSKPTATRHLGELAALNLIQSNGGRGAGACYIIGSWWAANGLNRSKKEGK